MRTVRVGGLHQAVVTDLRTRTRRPESRAVRACVRRASQRLTGPGSQFRVTQFALTHWRGHTPILSLAMLSLAQAYNSYLPSLLKQTSFCSAISCRSLPFHPSWFHFYRNNLVSPVSDISSPLQLYVMVGFSGDLLGILLPQCKEYSLE